ncbi:MAG: class I adenylate-forming enzyme family protein [Candidatus Sericytochromatia bacterium]
MKLAAFTPGPLHDLEQHLTLSAAEVAQEIDRRTAALQAAGLAPGDRVLLTHGNTWQFLVDLLAIWSAGGCAIPVDPQQPPAEMGRLARHAAAHLILYRPGFDSGALTQELGAEVHLLNSETLGQTAQAASPALELDRPALILYTSGSTGEPKGVVHSLRSLLARLTLLKGFVPLESLRRSLNLLPTHFGHGLICNCLYPWLNGQTLVLGGAFNLERLARLGPLIDAQQISFLSSVPTLWRLALRLSPPPEAGSLRLIHCGSAPLGAELQGRICTWSGIQAVRNTYGITETGSWLAGPVDSTRPFHDGYVGPVWGGQLRVVDDAGRDVPTQQPGKVLVQTPALMLGYWERPDLTAAALQQGWFLTGDIGTLDADGHLTLVGRERHEINKAGLKIYPEDIDLALERHPDVAEACAFALEDALAGQNVGVAVVPRSAAFDLEAVRTWLGSQLSPQKHPVRWFVVDSIPRTSRGKINRERVAQSLLEPKP